MRERRCILFPAIVKDSFANGFPPRRRTGWREEGQGGVREGASGSVRRVSWAGVGAGSERNNEFFRGVAGGVGGHGGADGGWSGGGVRLS